MINHLLSICLTIFIYEFIKFTNLLRNIQSNLKIYKKFLILFKYNKVSDFRKEKLTLNYSKSLLISSIKVIINIFVILILILILNKISLSFVNFILSLSSLAEVTIIFLIYHKFRKKIYAKLYLYSKIIT